MDPAYKKVENNDQEISEDAEALAVPEDDDRPTTPAAPLNYQGQATLDTVFQRLGTNTIIFLCVSFILELAAVAMIAWLWHGNAHNKTWLKIVSRNWTTRAVTLVSLVLRTGMAIQSGLCISMLAAIALERAAVPISNIAGVSLMRAGNRTDPASVLMGFTLPMLQKGPRRAFRGILLVMILLIVATAVLAQFTSTALVGDLSIQSVPGDSEPLTLAYDYSFVNRTGHWDDYVDDGSRLASGDNFTSYGYNYSSLDWTSSWQSKAPVSWPAFAEYSERPPEEEGINDTGVSLRAFLPFAKPEERQNVRNYTGKAFVFDSRVQCQKPVLTDVTFVASITPKNNRGWSSVSGYIEPSKNTSQMATQRIGKRAFNCTIPPIAGSFSAFTVCQLPAAQDDPFGFYGEYLKSNNLSDVESGGLKSMFRAPGVNQTGSAFIIATLKSWISNADGGQLDEHRGSLYTEVATEISPIEMTLCFAAFDVANRDIVAYSDVNRSEPSTSWSGGVLVMDEIVKQMDTGYFNKTLGAKTRSFDERGVLHLRPRKDWTESAPHQTDIDGPDQLPFVDGLTYNLRESSINTGETIEKRARINSYSSARANLMPYVINSMNIHSNLASERIQEQESSWSALMPTDAGIFAQFPVKEDTTVTAGTWVGVFLRLLVDDPAFALQSILTTLAGTSYYDRLGQYNRETAADVVFFKPAVGPQGPFGTSRTAFARGFTAVVIVLIIHLVIVIAIILRFVLESRMTRVGDGWQAVSQIALSKECVPIMRAASSHGGDAAVKRLFDQPNMRNRFVRASPDARRMVTFRVQK